MANNNGIIQNATSQLASKKGAPKLADYVKSMEKEIAKALPSVITPERFTRITLSALSSNPELQNTTPKSFLASMMISAQLGLEPNTPLGQAYLLPYRNKGVLECQFQIGYKGLIDLAYRSGDVSIIQAHAVYENDTFNYEYGLDPKLEHKPADKNRGDVIGYYAMFKMRDGIGFGFEYMSIEDIKLHAKKYSKSFSSQYSPWTTNFDEMAKKTVLKRVLKYAPLKSDFVRQMAADETIKTEISSEMLDVANEPIEAEGTVIDEETGEIKSEQ